MLGGRNAALDESFDEFLKRRESVSLDYINGSPTTLIAISTSNDPATFFPPSGDRISGGAQVNVANDKGAPSFKDGSTGRFEVLHSSESADLAFWSGMQHATVRMQGKDEPVPMSLRVTDVFRRENGEWKLVHRRWWPICARRVSSSRRRRVRPSGSQSWRERGRRGGRSSRRSRLKFP